MKPSFALDFRDGVIALLHRTTRGWQQVGATAIDAPDLNEALSYLRSTALGLSPRGLATKLVIPNEQILYTQVHAPGPDLARRRKQIKAGLEGLTPYDVEDLVFDWWGTGPEIQVAVVARETLAEAEGFAAEHRFNPVSFVAAPDDATYGGEPFFGASTLAASLLAEGEKVERDKEPISVVAREYPKADAAVEAAAPSPEPEPEPEVEAEAPAAPVAEQVAVDTHDDLADAPAPAPEVRPDPTPEPPAAAKAPEEAKPVDTGPLPDFSTARAPAAGAASFDPATLALDLVDEAPMALDVTDDPPEPPVRSPAPVQKDAAAETPAAAVTDAAVGDPTAPVVAAFSSRRTAEPGQAVTGDGIPADFAEAAAQARAKKAPALGPAPAQRPSVPRPALAKPAAPLPNASRNALPFPGRNQQTKFAPAKGKSGAAASVAAPLRRERNVVPLAKPASAVGSDGRPSDPLVGAKTASKGLTGLDGRPLPSRGRPRYLGLILTGLLLLALAAVAAWSSFYLTSNDVDPNVTPPENAVASDAGLPEAGVLETLPTPEEEALADGEVLDPESVATDLAAADLAAPDPASDAAAADAEAQAALEPEVAAEVVPDAVTEAVPEAVIAPETSTVAVDPDAPLANDAPDSTTAAVEPDVAADLSDPQDATAALVKPDAPSEPVVDEQVATAGSALPEAAPEPEAAPGTEVATDAAQAVVPGNDPQDEIFLAAADTPPQTSDPLVMPQMIVGTDPPPDLGAPPPPFGTVYTFDAEGRIQPTPEGVITPEGVLLVAGAPKIVPPSRPATLAAAEPAPSEPVAAVAPAAPVATGEITGADVLEADPALAGKKPRGRPEGLVDPAATADQQGEVLAPAPDSRFASVRPQKRPEALTQTAAAAPEVLPETVTNEAAAASLAANGVQASTSVLAVAVSRKPAARPSGMDQAVDAAVAAAVSAPDPQPEAQPEPQQQTASLAPEEQAEPEAEAPAPRLPTNASVARQATVKNALNLSRVSLLGIFGTASGRYALVRQSGGGVKKVVVGDNIDGGRVAAITATAVQYQKGGRMLTLALPQG